MTAHSCNTQLKDRVLWYDGDSTYTAANLLQHIQKTSVRYVDEITTEITKYNKFSSAADKITIKDSCDPISTEWNIPEEYKTLDVAVYVFDKLYDQKHLWSDEELLGRERRLAHELLHFEQRNMIDVLRAIIYIINSLTLHNVVWGIGRGSSVSSYVLYLIGVHDVDSYAFDLDITDFLHD